MNNAEFRFLIDVPVSTQWRNIELLRASVQSCLEAVFSDVEGSDAIAMVTGELLENAVKYGHWTNGTGVFRLRVWGDEETGHIEVENPVGDDDEGPRRVDELLAWMDGFATPEEAYQARMLQVAVAPRGTASGLGLARVVYEGGCRLRAETSEGMFRMLAEVPLHRGASAG
jgi:hypothetical protein